MLNIINATPHEITLVSRKGVSQNEKKEFVASKEDVEVLLRIPEGDLMVRVQVSNEEKPPLITQLGSIPVETAVYGEIIGLPPEKPDTIYVVSGMVASAAYAVGRRDCYGPGPLVRDKANPKDILGCLNVRLPTG